MTRRRIRNKQLANENKQNSILFKRSKGLAKKAEQLQILCGVDIAIIGHRQGGESNAILWPSPEVVEERVNKFMEFPALERNKKMVTQESYLEQTLNTERENIAKLKKAVAVKEGHQLLAQKPLDMMEMTELEMVGDMAVDMIKILKKRAEEINQSVGARSSPVEGGGVLLWDHGFGEIRADKDQGLMEAIMAVGVDKWFPSGHGGNKSSGGGAGSSSGGTNGSSF
ncbi:agamous-like MADS-box protein AGL80 [Andrographis paniculata]|uniref:agamous-like MADS-box protein AGL80 n=1 Tax=Andrographis paniculata TaxID=175694 RepID=UPI0021E719EF|nr:agamous-like MADS-box protein AGL80 [Andrographis paniculata]